MSAPHLFFYGIFIMKTLKYALPLGCALASLMAAPSALAAAPVISGQIALTGKIVDSTCELQIATPTVDLGTYFARQYLDTVGKQTTPVDLQVSIVNCGSSVNGDVALTGAVDSTGNNYFKGV